MTTAHEPAGRVSADPTLDTPHSPALNSSAGTHTPPASFGELFATFTQQISTLLHGEIELTKLKLKKKIQKISTGGVLLAAAAVLALFLLGWLLHTIEVVFAVFLPQWAASLIVVVILLLTISLLVYCGVRALRRSQEHHPDPRAGLEKDIEAVKKGLGQ